MMITILFILLIVVAFVHYILCYLIAIKANPNIKNADIDSIKNEVLNKSKVPAVVSVKDKMFWLFIAYIVITVYIAMNILDATNNYLDIYGNVAIEIISIIIWSLVCFIIPSILSFKLFMFVIKRKHHQSI